MNILITGAGGFIGNQIARELFRRKKLNYSESRAEPIDRMVLADVGFPPAARGGFDGTVSIVECDIGRPGAIAGILPDQPFAVFHLAAMVSGDGERNFDGCLRTNLDGTRYLLEACRATGACPRVVFASSLAVFGGKNMSPIADDKSKQIPQTTYGMTKLVGELLINDYSRKQFIDGRGARLPTIFVRPGRPNAAASSFVSSVIREPLDGQACLLPVPRSQSVPLLGYRRVVENLIILMGCNGGALGDDRTVTLPSTKYRIADMIAALERIAKERGIALGPIVDQPDDKVREIVNGWPVGTEADRALAIGLRADESVDRVICDYIEDFIPGRGQTTPAMR
jgi:nucleoside-diphosphate-sugar epimerase